MQLLADLHPLVVHFPVALFIVYALTEIIGIVNKSDKMLFTAHYLLLLGVVTAVGAVLTGNQAGEAAKLAAGTIGNYEELIESHETFATITLWFFLFVLIFRTYLVLKKKFVGRIRYLFILFAIIGSILIIETGYRGGELVFIHRIGTGILQNVPSN